VVSFLGIIVVAIGHTFNYHRDYHIPASEVNQFEHAGNWTPDAQGAAA
jgi:cytochrome o ubiquinol oxidase subunit 1